ncbi:hypothetical protein M408DRAFT_334414 [Serendipita vermifera MAFF 305830]|uniref:Uncharacterized protein n=1 Tax=Serendipita vermifera MAFF 305830 TaxID=933852 RepID=A0A0C2VYG6_SERVB|nr:hypothetical protein M408DRAFT_334414 [Serendipita vermifera MAFF 305830]
MSLAEQTNVSLIPWVGVLDAPPQTGRLGSDGRDTIDPVREREIELAAAEWDKS